MNIEASSMLVSKILSKILKDAEVFDNNKHFKLIELRKCITINILYT